MGKSGPQRSKKIFVTKVAIGNPHPIPAKEKKLEIEPSILKKYDVYWLTYKSLKPTIVGTGLQSPEFAWSIRDDMLDMSAKRLIAIIGVPKGTAQLELQMV